MAATIGAADHDSNWTRDVFQGLALGVPCG
jgi:hypothetical protein